MPVGTYTQQQAKCPKTGSPSQSLHRNAMLASHQERALRSLPPQQSTRRGQPDILTHWRVVNRGAAADTVQALVLCAFNTFSFPLCSLNKKKLLCKATFCSFLFSLCIYHVFSFFSEEEFSESVSSNSIRCLLRPLWP